MEFTTFYPNGIWVDYCCDLYTEEPVSEDFDYWNISTDPTATKSNALRLLLRRISM